MLTELDVVCSSRGAHLGEGVFVCNGGHGVCSIDRQAARLRACVSCDDRSHADQAQNVSNRKPCDLLGSEIERLECSSCKGTVRIKVFLCLGGFGRCQISTNLPDVHSCEGCPRKV